MKQILVLILILSVTTAGIASHFKAELLTSEIPTEAPSGAVVEPNAIPMYWTVCATETIVRGGPRDTSAPLYTLTEGTQVRVRELSQPTREWAMIEPARWVRITDLCRIEEP